MLNTEKMNLQEKMVIFTNILRNQGMLISIRTTSAAILMLVQYEKDFEEKHIYYSLKSIYLKDMSDEKKFDKTFKEVFQEKQNTQEKQRRQLTYNDNTNMSQFENNTIKQKYEDNTLEAVETIKKDNEEGRIKVNKVSNDSLIKLDGNDPRVYEACKRLSRKVANCVLYDVKNQTNNTFRCPRQ